MHIWLLITLNHLLRYKPWPHLTILFLIPGFTNRDHMDEEMEATHLNVLFVGQRRGRNGEGEGHDFSRWHTIPEESGFWRLVVLSISLAMRSQLSNPANIILLTNIHFLQEHSGSMRSSWLRWRNKRGSVSYMERLWRRQPWMIQQSVASTFQATKLDAKNKVEATVEGKK